MDGPNCKILYIKLDIKKSIAATLNKIGTQTDFLMAKPILVIATHLGERILSYYPKIV